MNRTMWYITDIRLDSRFRMGLLAFVFLFSDGSNLSKQPEKNVQTLQYVRTVNQPQQVEASVADRRADGRSMNLIVVVVVVVDPCGVRRAKSSRAICTSYGRSYNTYVITKNSYYGTYSV